MATAWKLSTAWFNAVCNRSGTPWEQSWKDLPGTVCVLRVYVYGLVAQDRVLQRREAHEHKGHVCVCVCVCALVCVCVRERERERERKLVAGIWILQHKEAHEHRRHVCVHVHLHAYLYIMVVDIQIVQRNKAHEHRWRVWPGRVPVFWLQVTCPALLHLCVCVCVCVCACAPMNIHVKTCMQVIMCQVNPVYGHIYICIYMNTWCQTRNSSFLLHLILPCPCTTYVSHNNHLSLCLHICLCMHFTATVCLCVHVFISVCICQPLSVSLMRSVCALTSPTRNAFISFYKVFFAVYMLLSIMHAHVDAHTCMCMYT